MDANKIDSFNAQFNDPFNAGSIPQSISQEQSQGHEVVQSQVQVTSSFQPQFQENGVSSSAVSTSQNFSSFQMDQGQTEKKSEGKGSNALGLISLIFSLLGVVFVLFVVTAPLGILFLILAFIFGLIGLFKKPRGKAVVGFFVSGLSLGAMAAFVYYVASLFYDPVMNLSERFTTEMKPRIVSMMTGENMTKFSEEEFEQYFEEHLESKIEAFVKTLGETEEIEGIGKLSEIKTREQIKNLIDYSLNSLMDSSLELLDEFANEKELSFDFIESAKATENASLTQEDFEDEIGDIEDNGEYEENFDDEGNKNDDENDFVGESSEEIDSDTEHGTFLEEEMVYEDFVGEDDEAIFENDENVIVQDDENGVVTGNEAYDTVDYEA